MTKNNLTVTDSSGNVFDDLGLPNAEARLIQAQMNVTKLKELYDAGVASGEGQLLDAETLLAELKAEKIRS